MMRIIFFLITLAPVACASSSVSHLSDKKQFLGAQIVTPCQLNREREIFIGQTVMVKGVYKTDGHHFEYVIDSECGKSLNAVDIGRHGQSKSYADLQEKWAKICDKTGESSLCVIQVNMKVLGSMRLADDGMVLDIISIEEQP